MSVPEVFQQIADHLWIVWTHHIFGSEELSRKSSSVAQRVPQPYVMINEKDAEQMKIQEGQTLTFEVEKYVYSLPVKINKTMPNGVAALPYGLEGMPATELPAWGILKKA
jgi:NADH-quinone oxidoreductase subunit G